MKANKPFFIPNKLGGSLPVFYNFVTCVKINKKVKRIDVSFNKQSIDRKINAYVSNILPKILNKRDESLLSTNN